MAKKDIIVRAYDLGGYGDIAGALRVTDYLARQGRNVGIMPMSDSAKTKLGTLAPDYPHVVKDGAKFDLVVDVAGHYQDSRNNFSVAVPNLFIEDMDNSSDRQNQVPLYIKTGLVNKGVTDEVKSCGIPSNPLFYRPFSEEEIPARKDLDPLEIVIKQIERKAGKDRKEFVKLVHRTLKPVSRFGFAYFNPHSSFVSGLDSYYVRGLARAAKECDERYALGLFAQPGEEDLVRHIKEGTNYGDFNFVSRDCVLINDPRFPTIVLLGAAPQLEVSKMFLSASIPPLVTGDLSLSDALYFLLTKDGQGFFYDCPNWKRATRDELTEILSRHNRKTSSVFAYDKKDVCAVLSDPKKMDQYRQGMRKAVLDEVVSRFGDTEFEVVSNNDDGFIPYGTPFIFQDAAGLAIDKLLTDKKFKENIEERRTRISGNKCQNTTVSVPAYNPKPEVHYEPIKESELIQYGDIKIEGRAFSKSTFSKKLMTYNESLHRIRQSGLQRHLRSHEAFGLIMAGLEGKLGGALENVYQNLLENYGEWLSLAVERNGDILAAYLDPEGLIWDGNNKYVKEDFKYAEKVEFDISGKPSMMWKRLREFNKSPLVKFLYGRIFKELPEVIQNESHVFLPPEGRIWPVGRGNYDGWFVVDCYYCNDGASRGVVVGAEKK